MKIYSSRQSKELQDKRQQYVDNYTAQKAAYDEYAAKIVEDIKNLLKPQIDNLPRLEVKLVKRNNLDYYSIYFSYKYKTANDRSLDYTYSDDDDFKRNIHDYFMFFKGISWNLLIYLSGEELHASPEINNVHALDPSDYIILKYTYEFFDKVNKINWKSILNKIDENAPKLAEFNLDRDTGELDTSNYDRAVSTSILDSYVGKDIWILVFDRSRRLASYRWYSDDYCYYYIKIKSATSSFYTIDYLSVTRRDSFYDHEDWDEEGTNYSHEYYYRLDGSKHSTNKKIKKTSLEVVEPIETMTTEELNDVLSNRQ